MKCNVGGVDRIFRIMLGLTLIFVGYVGLFSTGVTVAFYAVGAVALITGLFRFCPLYLMFGVNTCEPTMKQRF
jgi:hypothetical protein